MKGFWWQWIWRCRKNLLVFIIVIIVVEVLSLDKEALKGRGSHCRMRGD